MEKINILFLGGAKRVSVAEFFINAGKKLGKEVNIFSYELDKAVPIASLAKIIIGLKWNDPLVINHLKEEIEKNEIHIVLPFVDPATVVCANMKESITNVFIPVSGVETCNILFDKVKADKWFEENSFPVPKNNGSLPIIAKPRKGSASKGLVILKSAEDLNRFKLDYKEDDFLLQRFIDAFEYSVDAYVSSLGEIISVVPRKRLEVSSGEVTKSVTIKDEEIIFLSKKILSLLEFRGPITLQFLREKVGNGLYLMEINPRFGGGVVTAVKAGANFCEVILNEFLKLPVKPVNDWQENLIMTRAFREFYYNANNN